MLSTAIPKIIAESHQVAFQFGFSLCLVGAIYSLTLSSGKNPRWVMRKSLQLPSLLPLNGHCPATI